MREESSRGRKKGESVGARKEIGSFLLLIYTQSTRGIIFNWSGVEREAQRKVYCK